MEGGDDLGWVEDLFGPVDAIWDLIGVDERCHGGSDERGHLVPVFAAEDDGVDVAGIGGGLHYDSVIRSLAQHVVCDGASQLGDGVVEAGIGYGSERGDDLFGLTGGEDVEPSCLRYPVSVTDALEFSRQVRKCRYAAGEERQIDLSDWA